MGLKPRGQLSKENNGQFILFIFLSMVGGKAGRPEKEPVSSPVFFLFLCVDNAQVQLSLRTPILMRL
jgi:hypothetical protein